VIEVEVEAEEVDEEDKWVYEEVNEEEAEEADEEDKWVYEEEKEEEEQEQEEATGGQVHMSKPRLG
jgi:Ser-tRNA(Ala) deacylase AlaX